MTTMKRLIKPLLVLSLLPAAAFANTTIGVSMAVFDDNFLTNVREAMAAEGKSLKDVDLHFEDARNDVGRQVSQVENFVAQKVSAIIVNPVDTSATRRTTDAARKAGIPVIYVNRKPVEAMGKGAYFVGSESVIAGRLQMEYLAKKLQGKGTIAIMQGELSNEAALERTRGVKEVASKFPGIKIAEMQTANWDRSQGINLMRKWISAGRKLDAIASNNDEMALGALIAMKQAGVSPKKVLVGGVDATRDALNAMSSGDLAVTVFQDAKGQGKGAVKLAARLAAGDKKVPSETWVPYQLVTPENYKTFLSK
jgi:inositol transport system substrate-binding protein